MNNFLKTFFYLVFFAAANLAQATDAQDFMAELKEHYQSTAGIKSFSLTHSYLGRSDPFQSWDYKAPTRYKAFKVTEIDEDNQHYYQNVVHHFTGGLYFDEVHFQNSEESLRYERNGISLGKSAITQNMNSFTRYRNLTLMNLDFFAVRPLLKETQIDENVELKRSSLSETITLTHRASDKAEMEYEFRIDPVQLVSIHNKKRKRIYLYGDYRQNNGFYFAHSLIKKYNGDVKPSFITKIEKFETIKQIDSEKLALPATYTKPLAQKSSELTATAIGKDLYLVTDASHLRNVLFKVNPHGITVFGVSNGSKASDQVINIIKSEFPTKPITGVFVTHPYSDHISGLLPYVEQGAIIYADTYTADAIKAFPRFANHINKFRFKTLTNATVIDDVRFFVLENARSKRQSFAHFEHQGIIFQTDFLEVAFDNTIAELLPSYSKQFIDFVKNNKLEFNRIVGYHRNNNISPTVLEKSYSTNTL